ncbi:MAG: hypothetical protein BMS9Abin28_1019 [Anaerolineae bacterium]|nr:MAG: hypothetical protein BMS9Abin28_1019 [Anaerolineae bacterium]
MTQPNHFRTCLLIVLGVVSAACQTVAVTPTASPSPSSTPPPPTPIPPIRVISYHLSPGSAPGEWRVVGLIENQGQVTFGRVELGISLIDTAGKTIAGSSTGALMSNLLPGEASPFSLTLEAATAPAEARVEPLAFEAADGPPGGHQRAELISELEEFFITGSGELAVLGFVTNPGRSSVSLESLSFLGRGPDGIEKLVAAMQFGPNRLAPGETAPFMALAPENPGAVQWTPYHDGVVAEPPSAGALEIRGDPQLHLTAQGAPFVVGTLANSGTTASTGYVLVSLLHGSRLIGLWEIEIPRPLQAGEQLAFTAFGFPGVNLRFDARDASAIRVDTRVEESLAGQTKTPVVLAVDVSAFHSVGSAIFIRGTMRNSTEVDVEAARVYAEVRSSLGELVTAGWSSAESLEPDGSTVFVLNLPIPVGMDATLAEYDLRAIGQEIQP